jgi:hypothetical protein
MYSLMPNLSRMVFLEHGFILVLLAYQSFTRFSSDSYKAFKHFRHLTNAHCKLIVRRRATRLLRAFLYS